MAPGIAEGVCVGYTPEPIASGGVRGWLKWLAYMAVGCVMATPLTLKMLFRLVTNPRQLQHRKDRSGIEFPDPLPGLTHEWIETEPGIKLHAVRTSKGSGKPLMLLVHGFPEAWFSWHAQMADFRGEYEVATIDMRGYNLSSRPQGRHAYRMPQLVGDITSVAAHLLREAGQQQLVLVGHDWGANVCWAAAAASPALFSRLAILCVPHPACFLRNMDWDQLLRSWYIFAFQLPWLAEWALAANDYALVGGLLTAPPSGCTTPGAVSPEFVERYKQAFGRPGAPTALVNYYRAVIDVASRYPAPVVQKAMRSKCRVPTLMLWGEKDTALGTQLLRGTERYVETLRVEVLPCSHWVQQDLPEQVNALLRGFLRQA